MGSVSTTLRSQRRLFSNAFFTLITRSILRFKIQLGFLTLSSTESVQFFSSCNALWSLKSVHEFLIQSNNMAVPYYFLLWWQQPAIHSVLLTERYGVYNNIGITRFQSKTKGKHFLRVLPLLAAETRTYNNNAEPYLRTEQKPKNIKIIIHWDIYFSTHSVQN